MNGTPNQLIQDLDVMANPRFVIAIIAYAAAPGRLRGEAHDQASA
jgi:hypothetical protein